ncbi:MAG: hypothetical protein ACTHLT_02845 [Devosia sp.]
MTSAAENTDGELIETWSLPYPATLGSSVRSKGIFLEVRFRLPVRARKALAVKARQLTLRLPASEAEAFRDCSAKVSAALEGIENAPVLPREIEDILGIKATERHRWLKDGRLPSAGTRTVKLRGRTKKITFHVFDPRVVEAILDRDLVAQWREEDAERAAENRRRAVWKAKLTRSRNKGEVPKPDEQQPDDERFQLRGWAEFERDGPFG